MNDRPPFDPLQAQQVAQAFNDKGVGYLFIGKSGAILLGYPARVVHLLPCMGQVGAALGGTG